MKPARQGGFTYLGMIILVTVLGLVGAATLKIDALLRRAAAEQELLYVGTAFAEALTSYAAATPAGQPTQPPTLQDLLKDTRSPAIRRHLRKIFIDPITGSTDWGIVWLGDQKGIVAVYSKSPLQPLKIANFDARLLGFDNRQHISDWHFVASGPAPSVPQSGQRAPASSASLFPAVAGTAPVAPEPGAAPAPAPAPSPAPAPAQASAPVEVAPVPEVIVEEPKPEEDDGRTETPTVRPVRRD
ncbi:type II secretion system protein [Massilia sp. DWR3-1-1]|uniref:type II secretion system protein n=1 Tax=Massilia sp. DWR3-1-1 TaxID=2804559 RepID=UPI003CF28C95